MRIKKPVIGVSGSQIVEQDGIYSGYKLNYIPYDYTEAIEDNGGIPYIIPMLKKEENVIQALKGLDGIILSGGHDINPLLWGEEPKKYIGELLPERDEFDLILFKEAKKLNIPILGICRGHHLINIALGGSLHQDINSEISDSLKHTQNTYYTNATHNVSIKENTFLYNVLGNKCTINSFHHLAVKDLGEGLMVSAFAKDGVVEGIESEDGNIIGIQWHPEMMYRKREDMAKIFESFIGKCLHNSESK